MKMGQAAVRRVFVSTALFSIILAGGAAQAQTAPDEGVAAPPANPVAAPAPAPPVAPAAPRSDGLEPPNLDFNPDANAAKDYDKYFYFHRTNTRFAEAYADIRECDALASGSNIYLGNSPFTDSYTNNFVIPQYGAAGVLGGALAGAFADAVFGSAARRKERRIKIRNCMGFKGYSRYGISKELWVKFNFSEGNGRKKEETRDRAFKLQALAASGPQPQQEVLRK